jgi:hypothetical protein
MSSILHTPERLLTDTPLAPGGRAETGIAATWPNLLYMAAFAIDVLTPYLIGKGWLPDATRWISDAALALMAVGALTRALAFNRFPKALWFILVLSASGILSGILQGQSVMVTIWGWWLMFQYPLLAVFASLEPAWPLHFPRLLLKTCLVILGVEVLMQIYQYLRGTPIGDNLAGLFGDNGTGKLVLFILFTVCLCIGEWLSRKNWKPLAIVLLLGMMSSVLGEMKLFLPVLILLAIIAVCIYTWKNGQIWKLLPYGFILFLGIIGFVAAYDTFIPAAKELPLERYITDPQFLDMYLNISNRGVTGETYYTDIGRNFALTYGWQQINRDPITLLTGYGLGARSESRSLGFVGRGLLEGDLGITSGTSLLVIMQEMGIFGLVAFGIFILVVIWMQGHKIAAIPQSEASGMRYGVILFTLLWPLWVWYNSAWILRVPMFLYWLTLGYLWNEYGRLSKPDQSSSVTPTTSSLSRSKDGRA